MAALTVLCVHQIATKLYVDNSPEAFADSDSEAFIALEAFRDIFGRDDVLLVLVAGDVFSLPYLEKLERLHRELESVDLDLKTLGQRRAERNMLRRPNKAAAEAEQRAEDAATARGKSAAHEDDGFGDEDFDDQGDDFADFDDPGGEAGADWGDEEGGSIVDEVISLINVRKIRATDVGIDIGDLMDPMPTTADEIAALRRIVLGDPQAGVPPDPTIVGQVVSADGRYSVLVVRTQFMSEPDSVKVSEHIEELAGRYETGDFEIHIAGMPPLVATLQRMALRDMQVLSVSSLLIIGFMLLFMFVHPMAAVVPMMVVAASAIWSLGLMSALGLPMTMMTNILPSFLICVGVADSIHLMTVYRQGLLAGKTSHDAATFAVGGTGLPIFFTTVTTAVGLLSFQYAKVDAIGEMGLIGACGVFAAFFNTITLLPAMLSFNRKSMLGADRPRRMGAIDSFLKLCMGLSSGSDLKRRATLGVAFVVSVGAIYFASQLYVWHDPLGWIPGGEPIVVAFDVADENLGGSSNVQLLIEANGERGVKDLRLHQGLLGLEEHVKGFVHPRIPGQMIGSVRTLTDMLREINQALNGGGAEHYRLPDTQELIDNYFVLIESAGPEDLRRLMTLDARKTQVTISTRWLEATSYLPLAEYLEAGIAEHIPADVAKVTPTGTVYSMLSTEGQLLMDLIRTFGLAFAVITVLMMLLLRSVRVGLIAMAPNLLPIAYILGLMGLFQVPVDMSNLLIASIALGVAVDDTIHLCHHFRMHYLAHGSVEGALEHALTHTGRALVVTSVVLAAGFSVYLFSVMASLQRFGMLIALTVVFAVVLDLTVTPALIRTFFRDRGKS